MCSCVTVSTSGSTPLQVLPFPFLEVQRRQWPLHRSFCGRSGSALGAHAQNLRHGVMAAAVAVQEILVTTRTTESQRRIEDRLAKEVLKLDGGGIAAPRFALEDMRYKPEFDAKAFLEATTTSTFAASIVSAAAMPSTQSFLQQHAQIFPNGTVCVADVQNQGKGRGGNVWTSPRGCLMFSLLTVLDLPGPRLPFIQYVVSLAIVEAVQAEARQLLGDDCQLDIRIKWPNDIYSGSNKLGGILCHTVYRERQFQSIIGIGLNVSNAEPTTCLNSLLRDHQQGVQQSDRSISRERLLARLLGVLEQHIDTLKAEGFEPLKSAYLDSWLHTGQQVTIKGRGEEEDIDVKIQGLTSEGYLLAQDASGHRYSLSPDGNSLDFFQGLIKSKLPP